MRRTRRTNQPRLTRAQLTIRANITEVIRVSQVEEIVFAPRLQAQTNSARFARRSSPLLRSCAEPRLGQHLYTYNCRTWWGGCFSAYSVGIYIAFSFLSISTLFSLLSCNACFSILSVNSLFSVLSVNSMFALGCVGQSFAICY